MKTPWTYFISAATVRNRCSLSPSASVSPGRGAGPFCMPSVIAVPNAPLNRGSSLGLLEFRPQRGSRCRFWVEMRGTKARATEAAVGHA